MQFKCLISTDNADPNAYRTIILQNYTNKRVMRHDFFKIFLFFSNYSVKKK